MRKKLLPLGMLAALAGAAGGQSHMAGLTSGLIYPYTPISKEGRKSHFSGANRLSQKGRRIRARRAGVRL